MTVEGKLSFARQLMTLGVDVVEAGFPAASLGDFKAVRGIALEHPCARIAALARTTRGDIEQAARALEPCHNPRIHTFIATSDLHLRFKLKKSREQVLNEAAAAVEMATRYVDDVQFGAEDATRSDPDYVIHLLHAVVSAGARTVAIADTVGYSVPDEFGDLVSRVAAEIGESCTLSAHCHDDLGLSLANSLAAVKAGARQVECTVGGIGERAGNCALEELAITLYARKDILPYHSGVRLDRIYESARLLQSILGLTLQQNKAIVGRNALTLDSDPNAWSCRELLGVPDADMLLNSAVGKPILKQRLILLGHLIPDDLLEEFYALFVSFCQFRHACSDEELDRLAKRFLAPRECGPPSGRQLTENMVNDRSIHE